MTRRSEAEKRRAYRAAPNDAAAAALLGMSLSGYRQWRRRAGLPPKRVGRPLEGPSEAQRIRAYRSAEGDVEAAARLGMGLSSYRDWRRSRGL